VTAGPRTVLYLHSSAGRYGADRQLELVVRGLDPARYRPLVILADDGPLVGDLRDAGVETEVRPLAVVRRSLATPVGLARVLAAAARDGAGLAHLARARDVKLIHTNTSVTLGGPPAARLARVPHVWHLRETYAEWPRAWPVFRRLLLTADAVPTLSRANLEQLGGHRKGVLIEEGLPPVTEPRPRAEARAALGLPDDAFVIAHVGRISSWKGQDQLARALVDPALADRHAIGIVAGAPWPGEERHEVALRELAAELGLGDRLRLLGHRDDIETVHGAADVVAVPSTQPEPLGLVALEAAAVGLPVVAAAHGGLPEILRDGETGVLVPPRDPHALAIALAELADDPARAQRLGRAAATDVRERFSTARLLERTQALYDRLLA
jgi:glycosyltransferase involved in cell wall biosynthesis